ncbi:ROK family protein [Mollicutes bacterium LVI A0078]|nr:ROK family protein [Mollicutes bacterium LVI A0075]WOO90199.1 ROK family protein [Mollicutes bacterium LVI A0078]
MLVFDIGGTFIKYALVEEGTIVYKDKTPTPDGSQMTVVLSKLILDLMQRFEFAHIGISTAGQVDVESGSIIFAGPTLPNYTGVQLKSELEAATSLEVSVLNDVEACIYNYQQVDNLLYISLGTGIGGAYKTNGQIFRGENGVALEVGHLYHPKGDSFENICSTRSLLEQYKNQTNEEISGEQFDSLVASSDNTALKLIDQFFEDIAIGLLNIKYILDYNHVIIGGGITEAKFFSAEKVFDKLQTLNANTDVSNIKIETSRLGNDAAILGVYYYTQQAKEQNEI